jgi:gamma-tubulin complex component 2
MFATYTSTLSRTLFTCTPLLAGTAPHLSHLTFTSHRHKIASQIPEEMKIYDAKKLDNLTDMLGKYEYNFNHHLRLLLDALDYYAATETVALSRLCAVLGSATEGSGERKEV